MAKYGRNPRFGYALIPTVSEPTRPLQLAALAETLGLDYIGIQEHPDDAEHHDSWTLLSAIGAGTSRISIIANGDDLPPRPPEQLAKVAASLDLLTNGRVDIALGDRAFCNPNQTAEGQKRTDMVAMAELEEALQIMRLMWSGEPSVHFEGRYYQLGEAQTGPAPSRPIGIWLRANNAHALALTGQIGDGWMAGSYPATPSDDLATWSKRLDEATTAARREPSVLQRVLTIKGTISDEESSTPFQGTATQWGQAIADLAVEVGIDTFLLMEGENAEEQLQRFAQEVVPYVRDLVAMAPGVVITTGLARAQQGSIASGATPAEDATDNVDWVDETSMESFPASDPPASSSFT